MPQELFDQDTTFVTARTPLKSAPVGSLFITHGPMAGKEIPLSGETFFIGRSRNNNLVLSDKSVSRKHAVINFLEGEYIVSDLKSLKGIYVNGKKIDEASLKPGDIVNIGENRMQFRLFSPSGAWIVPGNRRWAWVLIVVLLLSLIAGGSYWYYQKNFEDRLPEEVITKIELHYNLGVELFNKKHDTKGAAEEWRKVLELDPDKKSPYAQRAEILIKGTDVIEEETD